MKIKSVAAIVLALMVGMAGISTATILLSESDWDDWTAASANPPSPVQTGAGDSQLPTADADIWGGGGSGVQFSGDDTAGGVYDDLIYETGGSSELTVDVDALGYEAVLMSFYNSSATYAPDELSLYFETADGFSWYYDLAPADGIGTTTYAVTLYGNSGWYSDDGGTDFETSLDAGDLVNVGINLLYEQNISENQEYGISQYAFADMEGFTVPEPGTYMVLSVAFMSLGFSFRRRERGKKDVA